MISVVSSEDHYSSALNSLPIFIAEFPDKPEEKITKVLLLKSKQGSRGKHERLAAADALADGLGLLVSCQLLMECSFCNIS